MQVLIVRHGESVWNRLGLIQGQQDPALSPEGREQARRVGRRLVPASPVVVYTSDLRRAHETAEIVAESTGARIVVRRELREIGMGAWEGLTAGQARRRFPEVHAAWRRDSGAHRPPGGESYGAVLERVARVLTEVEREGTLAAVVTHSAPARALLAAALGAPQEAIRWFSVDHGSLSRLTRTEAATWRLTLLNDTCHLSETTPGARSSADDPGSL